MRKFTNSFDPLAAFEPHAKSQRWFYGAYGYESYLHRQLQLGRLKAELHVCYPGVFPLPAPVMQFRAALPAGSFTFHTNGETECSAGNFARAGENQYTLHLTAPAEVILTVSVPPDDVPALWSDAPAAILWQVPWHGTWRNADIVKNTANETAPHLMPPHRQELPLARQNNIWDASCEVLADVYIESGVEPVLRVGESLEEAQNDDAKGFEQLVAVKKVDEKLWQSAAALAFRYVRIANAAPDTEVSIRAHVHPVVYHGTFVSDDTLLNQIWNTAAYTLHLCMQGFILDGIKRDRMPWGGDIWVGLLADTATFFDAAIARSSLSVFLAAGGAAGDVNTIVDYSLLLVVSFDEYCRYFGDNGFLASRWSELRTLIENLLARCDENGLLTKNITRIFIDWVALEHESAVQMLFARALESAARLARRMKAEALACRAETHRQKLLAELEARYFDPVTGFYRTKSGEAPDQLYPQALAIWSGLAQGERAQRLCEALVAEKFGVPGTPYAAQLVLTALAEAGAAESALTLIKRWWKPMLDAGATTFFEAGKESPDATDYSFYGRPFGKSLCHAWAAGVTWLIPRLLTGIAPLADGWHQFKLHRPAVTWDFEILVPTPYGAIRMVQEAGQWRVETPPECEMFEE